MDKCNSYSLEIAPWPVFNYKPSVTFSLAHSNDSLLIKFKVKEHAIKAEYINTNDPVFKDTCVEFFIALGEEKEYYNFEFNCIGTCLSAFGASKENRTFLSEDIINNIKYQVLLKKDNTSAKSIYKWELTVMIPLNVFCFHHVISFKGMNCFANFYKCGDSLPEPHFLSWNSITSPEPNFHLRDFFGKVNFI